MLQFDVKTSCRQVIDLFEIMQQPSAPSGEWYWRILLENSVFFPPRTCSTPHSGWTPCDINVTYTSLKVHLIGYKSVADNTGLIFIRLAVIAPETREMSRNSNIIWPYSSNSSRSSKVIFGVNEKPILCDFLLLINCNFSRVCYSGLKIENCWFYHPSLVKRLRLGEPVRMSGRNLASEN